MSITRRSKFTRALEPVIIGLSYVKRPEGCRYDLIGSSKEGTVSLILNHVSSFPDKQEVIIQKLPLEQFLDQFRKWYKENGIDTP